MTILFILFMKKKGEKKGADWFDDRHLMIRFPLEMWEFPKDLFTSAETPLMHG